MRDHRSYPQHRCPLLAPATEFPFASPVASPPPLTPAHQRILASLRGGARVLLDLSRGQAMVYRMRQGIEQVMRLTVRTLALLVRRGVLAVSNRHGSWVHYTYVSPAH